MPGYRGRSWTKNYGIRSGNILLRKRFVTCAARTLKIFHADAYIPRTRHRILSESLTLKNTAGPRSFLKSIRLADLRLRGIHNVHKPNFIAERSRKAIASFIYYHTTSLLYAFHELRIFRAICLSRGSNRPRNQLELAGISAGNCSVYLDLYRSHAVSFREAAVSI